MWQPVVLPASIATSPPRSSTTESQSSRSKRPCSSLTCDALHAPRLSRPSDRSTTSFPSSMRSPASHSLPSGSPTSAARAQLSDPALPSPYCNCTLHRESVQKSTLLRDRQHAHPRVLTIIENRSVGADCKGENQKAISEE